MRNFRDQCTIYARTLLLYYVQVCRQLQKLRKIGGEKLACGVGHLNPSEREQIRRGLTSVHFIAYEQPREDARLRGCEAAA